MSVDVIIIGGGISGLVAAERLSRAKELKVLVLEAADRIGGRILSEVKDGLGTVEYGGHVLQPSSEELLKLMQYLDDMSCYEMGTPWPQGVVPWASFWGGDEGQHSPIKLGLGRPPVPFAMGAMEAKFVIWKMARLAKDIDFADPYKNDCKVAQELDNTTVKDFMFKNCTFSLARDMIFIKALYYGMDPTTVSMLTLLTLAHSVGGPNNLFNMDPPQKLGVSGGMASVCHKLAEKIGKEENIKLGKKVTGIKKTENGEFEVETADESFTAKNIILATTPNRYSDFLTQIVDSDSDLGKATSESAFDASPVTKFTIGYEKAFWKEEGQTFSGSIMCLGGKKTVAECSGVPLTLAFDSTEEGNGMAKISGYIAGKSANEWMALNDDELLKETLLSTITALVGKPWPKDEIKAFELKHWAGQEPDGMFAAVYPAVGAMEHLHLLRKPQLEGKLNFASTVLATKSMFDISGAIQSGRRAALNTLENIKPEELENEELKFLGVKN